MIDAASKWLYMTSNKNVCLLKKPYVLWQIVLPQLPVTFAQKAVGKYVVSSIKICLHYLKLYGMLYLQTEQGEEQDVTFWQQ